MHCVRDLFQRVFRRGGGTLLIVDSYILVKVISAMEAMRNVACDLSAL